jgi:hypothetical protein
MKRLFLFVVVVVNLGTIGIGSVGAAEREQEPTFPSLTQRINRVMEAHWTSTLAATLTHRRNAEIASETLVDVLAEIRPIGEAGELRRDDFLDHLPHYRRLLRQQPKLFEEPDCMTAYHLEMLGRLESAVRALGAEPIFILSPATKPRCEVHEAHRQGLLPNLLAIDDARKYPRVYQIENRFDAEHLNRAGAEIYTRLLADRFAEYLDGVSEGGRR